MGMTKQQEIREGIVSIAKQWFSNNGFAYQTMPNDRSFEGDLLAYLHSQGVVIKAEKELPENNFICNLVTGEKYQDAGYRNAQRDMLKAGYVVVEPLIKEGIKWLGMG